jgi:hypothetical protein
MSKAWRAWSAGHVAGIRERRRQREVAAAGGEVQADDTLAPAALRGSKRDPLAVMAEALSYKPALPPGRAPR